MFSLIPDAVSYIWLFVLIFSAYTAIGTEESFPFNIMLSSFISLLCFFEGYNFYEQTLVFFIVLASVWIIANAVIFFFFSRKKQ